jgi:hypothetical protein
MNHSFFHLEHYVVDAIERIASDRAASGGITGEASAPAIIASARRRLGVVLIKLGERVGGPAVRAPQPPAPLPTHTPMFGF